MAIEIEMEASAFVTLENREDGEVAGTQLKLMVLEDVSFLFCFVFLNQDYPH